MDDRLYWIWLQDVLSPGSYKADAILREFGTARNVYELPAKSLEHFKLTDAQLARFADKSLKGARSILNAALTDYGWVLTPEDALYPSILRAIQGIPLVLYGRGEFSDLDLLPSVAIVGTRAVTAYGRRATAMIAGGLSLGGTVIVSGGAWGVDTIAHLAALAADSKTIAVLGCGTDIVYPPQNGGLFKSITKKGAVVSEYPPGTPPLRHHFPQRNRLISGMCLGVCITEAPAKSGAIITANYAFEQGRDVFAVAGDMLTGRSAGTDILIRRGAQLITNAKDILQEYIIRFPDIIDIKATESVLSDSRFDIDNLLIDRSSSAGPITGSHDLKRKSGKPKCPDGVSENACCLFKLLDCKPRKLDELIDLSKLQASQVMTALTELELAGGICCTPERLYCLCK